MAQPRFSYLRKGRSGHVLSMDQLPPLAPGDLFIQGHTHVPVAECRGNLIMLNPGSISLPKENNPNSYAILEDNIFRVMDFEGNELKRLVL